MMKIKIIEEIKNNENTEYANHHYKFFKAFKGGYGEGDKFYGLKVPKQREIAKKFYKDITNEELKELIKDEYHEVRMTALFIMVLKSKNEMSEMVKIYLDNLKYVNNWDLVDLSASYLLGKYAYEEGRSDILYELSKTHHLWSERVSVVASHYFIKRGDFEIILKLSEHFLTHKHDLMHKACGWMLREVGKINEKPLLDFLDKHYKKMPRTMLRYSIERLSEDKKAHYMKKD
ncbi:MAG: DNA alkylation repair enzyme [Alphaproteobacteria bacterium ADurb.Bin438]|nr:MAG: DNA alkylation repair enzyme [Alphaproteobacteria bacterium ADurb.Bin438]